MVHGARLVAAFHLPGVVFQCMCWFSYKCISQYDVSYIESTQYMKGITCIGGRRVGAAGVGNSRVQAPLAVTDQYIPENPTFPLRGC